MLVIYTAYNKMSLPYFFFYFSSIFVAPQQSKKKRREKIKKKGIGKSNISFWKYKVHLQIGHYCNFAMYSNKSQRDGKIQSSWWAQDNFVFRSSRLMKQLECVFIAICLFSRKVGIYHSLDISMDHYCWSMRKEDFTFDWQSYLYYWVIMDLE